jgi:hypothetical protein
MTGSRRSTARPRRGWAGPVSAAPVGESGDQQAEEDEAGSSPYDVVEELPDRVKRRIAAELAIFRTSIEIKALLRERHGIQARLREVMRFAEPLRTLFEQLSADYVNEPPASTSPARPTASGASSGSRCWLSRTKIMPAPPSCSNRPGRSMKRDARKPPRPRRRGRARTG